jgi:hypothetical protein
MVALGEDASAPPERAVDASRRPHCETAHASRELALVPGFDEQMHVVVLYREMHHAKVLARGARDRPSHASEDGLIAKPPDASAHRDVKRVSGTVLRARAMRHRPPVHARLAARPVTLTAPRPPSKIERELLWLGLLSARQHESG